MKFDKKITEYLFIFFFILIFFILASNIFLEKQIVHDFSYGYMANDAFLHLTVAKHAEITGYWNKLPDYVNRDNLDLFNTHPPILPIISIFISKFSGIDIIYLYLPIIILLTLVMVLINYLIIREMNNKLAIFSLPLALFMFTGKFSMGLTWGFWDFLVAQLFLFAFVWSIFKIDLKKSYWFIALFISTSFFSHGVEAVWCVIFSAIFLGFSFLLEKNKFKKYLKKFFSSSVLAFLICAFFMVLWLNTMVAQGNSQFFLKSASETVEIEFGNNTSHLIFFNEWSNVKYILIFGGLFSLFILFKKRKPITISYYFLILFASFLIHSYVFGGFRGFQIRYLWPIFLMSFFGYSIYAVYLLIKEKIPKEYVDYSPILISFLIIIFIINSIYLPFSQSYSGILDKDHSDAINWINKNTELTSDVLILYGEKYGQSHFLRLLERKFDINRDRGKIIQRISEQSTNLNFSSARISSTSYFIKKEHYKFPPTEDYLDDSRMRGSKDSNVNRNICSYDYVVFDTIYVYSPEIPQYLINIATQLINNNISIPVYQNNQIVILKNIWDGDYCEI